MVGMDSRTSRGLGREDYEVGELGSTFSLRKVEK